MEHTILITALVSGAVGLGLGFIACAMLTAGKTEDLLAEVDELDDLLTKAEGDRLAVEAERDHYKAQLDRLTDRDARGRFVKDTGE